MVVESRMNPLRPGINLLTRDTQVDPFPTYARMRREFPVCRVEPHGVWAISRYADVRFALRSPDLFSSAAVLKLFQPEWLHKDSRRDYSILSQDPPVHTENRSIINKAFISGVINRLETFIRRTAQDFAAQLPIAASCDFLGEFSLPYAATILTHITGTAGIQAAEDLRRWDELSEVLTLSRPDDEHIAALERVQLSQRNCFRAVIEERRRNPGDDFVSELLRSEIDGVALSDAMIVSLLELLFSAGFKTVSDTLCHCVIFFARRPDLVELLRKSPDRIPAFIEEMIRFDPSTHYLLRQTTADLQVADVMIPAESLVLLMLGSANRDSEQFPEPDDFILDRPNIREHLAFGAGPHSCIGIALARMEIKVALEALLEKFSSVQVPPDSELEWLNSMYLRATRRLPVVLFK